MAPLQTDQGVEILGTTTSIDRHINSDKAIVFSQSDVSKRKGSTDNGKFFLVSLGGREKN